MSKSHFENTMIYLDRSRRIYLDGRNMRSQQPVNQKSKATLIGILSEQPNCEMYSQYISWPPETLIVAPVMYEASLLIKNATVPATSSGEAILPRGTMSLNS